MRDVIYLMLLLCRPDGICDEHSAINLTFGGKFTMPIECFLAGETKKAEIIIQPREGEYYRIKCVYRKEDF